MTAPRSAPTSSLPSVLLGAGPRFSGRILVVRRDNIGDLVCTTPLLAALRQAFPRATIAVLANSYNAAILDRHPDVDAVYVYTKLKHRVPGTSIWGPVRDRLHLIRDLRRQRFDLAILARSSFDRHGLAFVRWLGIPQVIGFAGPASHKGITCPVPVPDNAACHEVEALWPLLAPLGITQPPGPLRLAAPVDGCEGHVDQASRGSAPRLAIHISAREPSRRLSEAGWTAYLRQLATARPDLVLALFWSPGAADDPRHPGDDALAHALLAALKDLPLIPCPTQSLPELMVALSGCAAFVGADGGAMHVAAGLGLPVVALFENSPFKLRHWAPWQVPHEKVVSPTFAIGDIAPTSILEATLRLLGRCRST